jgi:hypothetical protein
MRNRASTMVPIPRIHLLGAARNSYFVDHHCCNLTCLVRYVADYEVLGFGSCTSLQFESKYEYFVSTGVFSDGLLRVTNDPATAAPEIFGILALNAASGFWRAALAQGKP